MKHEKLHLRQYAEDARRAGCARRLNLQLFAEPRNAVKKFWAFEGDELRLDGVIAEDSWWDDVVTPAAFRAELAKHPGNIRVIINSPGGDVVAGSQIYSALQEHKRTKKCQVTVAIDGLAASAASVIAMAGDTVQIAPTAYIMIHNAWTWLAGDAEDLRKYADWLDEVDAGIRMAYKLKTGLDDKKLDELMQADTWMNSESAKAYGFADEILYTEKAKEGAGGSPASAAAAAGKAMAEGVAAGLDGKRPGVTWSQSRQIAALVAQVKAKAPAQTPTAQTTEPAAPTPPATPPAAPAAPNDDERKLAAARLALLSEMA